MSSCKLLAPEDGSVECLWQIDFDKRRVTASTGQHELGQPVIPTCNKLPFCQLIWKGSVILVHSPTSVKSGCTPGHWTQHHTVSMYNSSSLLMGRKRSLITSYLSILLLSIKKAYSGRKIARFCVFFVLVFILPPFMNDSQG